MLIMTALVMVPMLVAGIFFFNVFSTDLQHQAESYLDTYMTTVNQNLENHYSSIDSTSMTLIANRDIRALLLRDDLPTSQRASQMAQLLQYQLFFNRSWDDKLVERIFICRSDKVYYSIPEAYFDSASTAAIIDDLYRTTDGLVADKYLIPPHGGENKIYFFRNINDINTTVNLGRMFLEIDPAKFIESVDTIKYEGSIMLTFDDSGTIFSHSDPAQIGISVDRGLFDLRSSVGTVETTLDGRVYLATVTQLADYDLYSLVAVPKAEVFASLDKARVTFLEFLAALLIVCLFLTFALSRRVFRPIRTVMDSLQSFRSSHFAVRIPRQNSREFDELADGFNSLAGEIDHLINEVYEKQLLLRESEIQALQSQVNPHFLFNVLETIGWQASLNDDTVIQTMVASLGQLLRSNLSWSGSETITVADELRYIRFYLDLQKIRFEDRIQVDIDISDDALLDLYITKLSIMPMVENAFIHGLEPKKGQGHLRIRIWDEGERLYFEVSDDGVGFDASTLHLDAPANRVRIENDHTSIGIVNSHRRIRLLYGPEYGIRVDSRPGQGTTVTVTLPKVKTAPTPIETIPEV
jgi:two-component system sensor histidine kinase YesM